MKNYGFAIILGLIVVSFVALNSSSVAQDKTVTVSWQYKEISYSCEPYAKLTPPLDNLRLLNNLSLEMFQKELKEAGNEGWELVSVVVVPTKFPNSVSWPGGENRVTAFLKKRN